MDTLKLSGRMIEINTNKNLDSKVDLPDYANDSKATSYINKNTTNKGSIEKAIISHASSLQANAYCAVSGIGFTLSLPSELHAVVPSVVIPSKSILSLANGSSRDTLYKLPLNILAGIVLTAFSNKDLLRSKDSNAFLTNSILCTAGKSNLVESIVLYNLIVANGIDSDTLPKMDITLATHYEGIANFEQPLSEYLSNLTECITEQTESEAQRRSRAKLEREEQAIQARQKQEARKNKSLDSTYETKRKLAYSALKDATIDLIYLKAKRLVEVTTIIVAKNGSATKEEIKTKVLTKFDEILSTINHENNADLVSNIYIIKDFVKLSLADRITNKVDSTLERASDVRTTDELTSTNKNLSLKEKLALAKARLAEKEGV